MYTHQHALPLVGDRRYVFQEKTYSEVKTLAQELWIYLTVVIVRDILHMHL